MQHRDHIKLPFTSEQLFDLVVDVKHYMDFLPGWQRVNVIKKTVTSMLVEQRLDLPFAILHFHSFARLDRPNHIHITASGGPFQHLDIHWEFKQEDQNTDVSLIIDPEFKQSLQDILFTSLLKRSTRSLMDRFAARAYELYGSPNQAHLH